VLNVDAVRVMGGGRRGRGRARLALQLPAQGRVFGDDSVQCRSTTAVAAAAALLLLLDPP